MIAAGMTSTSEAVRSWPIATIKTADCVTGDTCGQGYGVRLPIHYTGDVPPNMQLLDIAEAEYLVFEHGPFDYEQENRSVEHRMEEAITAFDFTNTGYRFDDTAGRMLYFYFQRSAAGSIYVL